MRYILRGGHVRCSTKTKRRARPGADVTPPPDAPELVGRGDLNSVCERAYAGCDAFFRDRARLPIASPRAFAITRHQILIRSAARAPDN